MMRWFRRKPTSPTIRRDLTIDLAEWQAAMGGVTEKLEKLGQMLQGSPRSEGHATGGPVADGWYIVGEHGPESPRR